MDYKKKILQLIKDQIDIEIRDSEILIETPPNPEMGDYTFHCFQLSNALKKAPNIIAEELKNNITCDDFEKVVALGPYLNFFIDKNIFIKNVLEEILIKGKNYGGSKVGEGKTICIEYLLVDIHQIFNIQQLFTTIVGNSLCKLFKTRGYHVERVNNLRNKEIEFCNLNYNYDDCESKEDFYSDKIDELVNDLRKKELLIESNGVEVVNLKDYDMPPYIILNNDKQSIYTTRNLSTVIHRKKIHDFYKYIYVDVTAKDLYFKQLFKVLELSGHKWAGDCIHAGLGLVKFADIKLLTRKKEYIILEDLINEATTKVLEIINKKGINIENKKEVAKKVGIGAVAFTCLKNSREKEIIFDLNKEVSFENESAFYVQYSYEIANNILRSAEKFDETPDFSKLTSEEEGMLVKLLEKFEDVIHLSINKLEPSIITRYLIEVTNAFNKFYETHSILILENKKVMKARLVLVEATCQVIENALDLICITL